jgi:lipase chaperone LimK
VAVEWGTVLASGTFSAVIAGGFALAGQRWQRRHEREEAMRARLIGALDDFLAATGDANGALTWSLNRLIIDERSDGADEDAERASGLIQLAMAKRLRVELLLGPDSEASTEAARMTTGLLALEQKNREAISHLGLRDGVDRRAEAEAANATWAELAASRHRFLNASRAALRAPLEG